MQVVDWNILLSFIRERNSVGADALRGVPRTDIEACEREYGIQLPSNYVGFLLLMGEDSAGLSPLGATHDHAFTEMVAQLPAATFPPQQYFKVAVETDPMSLAYMDKFLDLKHGDSEDAPIVEAESSEYAEIESNNASFSFGETITRNIFARVELARRDFVATVLIDCPAPTDGPVVKQQTVAFMAAAGFSAALPELPRIACLSHKTQSALVVRLDEAQMVALELAGDNLGELESLLIQALNDLPGATATRTPCKQADRFET